MVSPQIRVRRSADRYVTRADGITSWHCFSFGRHYDPDDTSYGLLLAHNDETVQPGHGFGAHEHRDTEIVTWVVTGTLVHEDSAGRHNRIPAGTAQRLSAGHGVVHAETAPDQHRGACDIEPVRFVQMWVVPDEPGGEPSYAQRPIAGVQPGSLAVVASGLPRHRDEVGVGLGQSAAALHVGSISPGASLPLPQAPYLHVFVVTGRVDLDTVGSMSEGDSAAITGMGGIAIAGAAPAAARVLVWEMHASVG